MTTGAALMTNNSVTTTNAHTGIFVYSGGTWTSTTSTTANMTNVVRILPSTDDILKALKGDGLRVGPRRILKSDDDGNVTLIETHTARSKSVKSVVNIAHIHQGVIDFSDTSEQFAKGTVFKLPNGDFFEIGEDGGLTQHVYKNARKKTIDVVGGSKTLYESLAFNHFKEIHIPAGSGSNTTFVLPDGTEIKYHYDDRIEIDDSKGKRLYQSAPTRGFNKYLNASDLLEDFVRYCASERLSRKDFAELPLSLFIYWLIAKAAEADGDSTDDIVPLLETSVKQQRYQPHRCQCCGKSLSKRFLENHVHFCSASHMQLYMDKAKLS